MRISTATIDCWLYATGQSYSEFQHHHWDIGPSATIDDTVNNKPTYIWTLNGSGSKGGVSWSTISQSQTITDDAQVRISAPGVISLKQTVGIGTYQLLANGIPSAQTHPVEELTWPADLTWNENAAAPSSITYRDMGQPDYQLITIPVVIPGSRKEGLQLVESFALVPRPGAAGSGGRNWENQATFWQPPGGYTARAWWAWTINLF
jgi:hypothetical protein